MAPESSEERERLNFTLALRAKKPYPGTSASTRTRPHWPSLDAYCSQTLSVPRIFSRAHSVGELCKSAAN